MKFGLFFIFFLFCHSVAAKEVFFAYDQQWLALLHYQPGIFSEYVGTIDSADFYLAENGRYDPEAELLATVELFSQGVDHETICRFPARYKLLLNKRLIKETDVKCKEYDDFLSDLRPAGIALLFTDAYMNNPSSMFGHTLLRINTSRNGTQMLAHGANYGAFTEGKENTLLYAVYGLSGGYDAGWTVRPYHNVINTYNNIENRDIWEFQLDFSAEERDMLAAHLWELGHTRSRYYFFTNNCSYMIMEVLDAVRPSLRLARQFPLQTIPLDTVKAVFRAPGLVKDVNYRPSRRTEIVNRLEQMNLRQKRAFLNAVRKQDYDLPEIDAAERAEVLETVYQYIQYQFVSKELEISTYRRRSFAALTARNRLRVQKVQTVKKNEGSSPLRSHEAMQTTFGIGSRNSKTFQEISYRPAYHSLTDANDGLVPGAEINFLNTSIRRYLQTDKIVLNSLNLVGIKSLAPADAVFDPVSFAINIDVAREFNPDNGKEGYVLNAKAGGGKTIEPVHGFYLYAMGNIYGSYGGFLPHNQYVGVGLSIGIFADFRYFKLLGEAEKTCAGSRFGSKTEYRAEAAMPLSINWRAAVEYRFKDYSDNGKTEEWTASLRYFF